MYVWRVPWSCWDSSEIFFAKTWVWVAEEACRAIRVPPENSEIAAILWISPNTVRKHLENIYAKLNVTNRAGAVANFLGGFSQEQPATAPRR